MSQFRKGLELGRKAASIACASPILTPLVVLCVTLLIPDFSIAQTLSLRATRSAGLRLEMVWRLDSVSKSEMKHGVLLFEARTGQGRFMRVRAMRASRRGIVRVPDRSDGRVTLRARLKVKRKHIVTSRLVTLESRPSDDELILESIEHGSLGGGGATQESPNAELLAGQSECPADVIERIVTAVNSHRRSIGVAAVTRHPSLDLAARLHSIGMAGSERLSHDGWFANAVEAGYPITYLSQNVARYIQSPEALVDAWIQSPGHLGNIESRRALHTGVGCVRDARGEYWWTQYFGAS